MNSRFIQLGWFLFSSSDGCCLKWNECKRGYLKCIRTLSSPVSVLCRGRKVTLVPQKFWAKVKPSNVDNISRPVLVAIMSRGIFLLQSWSWKPKSVKISEMRGGSLEFHLTRPTRSELNLWLLSEPAVTSACWYYLFLVNVFSTLHRLFIFVCAWAYIVIMSASYTPCMCVREWATNTPTTPICLGK